MGSDTVILILGGVGLAAVVLTCLLFLDRQRRAKGARLAAVLPRQAAPVAPTPQRARRRKAEATVDDPRLAQAIFTLERMLAHAGLRLTGAEALMQMGIAMLALFAGLTLGLRVHPLAAIPVSGAMVGAAAALIIRVSYTRRLAAFTAGLPEALDVFARGLRAGRPVTDSLSIVLENAQEPVRGEMAICHGQLKMGASLADSFADLSARIPTPEASFFGVATALQAETGGNLIETMENLAIQLRERRKLKKKARALSSEARANAVILAALPFAVSAVIFFLNPGYLAPLVEDPRGRWMLAAALTGIGLGVTMMVRMGKLDV